MAVSKRSHNFIWFFLSEDGTLEYRYKVITETIVPGKTLMARCVKNGGQNRNAYFSSCSSFIEFSIPLGVDIEDLYYTEIICRLKHGVHPREDCARPKTLQFRNGQINHNETAEEWKRDKDACIAKRQRMARKIYSRNRKRNGF